MVPPSPSLSSFDPALHFHSEDPGINPQSESFSDDLEAIHIQRLEQTRSGVVIQHRAWDLSDVFRSDDDIRPDTPTKVAIETPRQTPRTPFKSLGLLPSSPPVARMPFMSSPAVAAPGNAAGESQKRKATDLEETPQPAEPKRQRILGGFVDEDDEDDEIEALRDEQLKSQFELQESLLEQPPHEIPGISEPPQTSTDPGKRSSLPSSVTNTLPQAPSLPAREAPKRYQAPSAASRAPVQESIEDKKVDSKQKKYDSAMWTEKYRARKFTDLIGDERTHRAVLRWLKGWDPIVFPGLARHRAKKGGQEEDDERMHRKVLLLSGPPGLGKTTLAHVCAKQAGYEVLEINASDERSKDVVKGRIRDALGTENVKGMNVEVGDSKVRRAGKPVCVVVDEVDGVVGGAGSGGEGGFMKALIDLVLLDQRNLARSSEHGGNHGKKRKGDNFRFLRPLILVCNDVYHSSLRPLRASSLAEMIHVRQAPLENVVQRVKTIFGREGILCDNDGARRLCEAAWGLASRRQRGSKTAGSAEGDIRSVLVAAEMVAHKLRNESSSSLKLTRAWLEQRVLSASTEGGSFFKELSRGGVREIVNRVFTEGAGFSNASVGTSSFQDRFDGPNTRVPVGVADLRKRHAINRLREMVDASGDHDRCVADCFTSYPIQQYQDDTFLSKPNAACDWLHFHDTISSKVYSSQEWELGPYLSQSVVAFHHLFASAAGKTEYPDQNGEDDEAEEEHPFSGPKAEFVAHEAQKQNRAILNAFHTSFSAPLVRMFQSPDTVIVDLVPHLMRMLSPDIKPVIFRGGSDQRSVANVRKEGERALVQSAVRVMAGLGVTFEKVRVEHDGGGHGGWAYRMEPPIDSLVYFSKIKSSAMGSGSTVPVRYAVRQVLDQEYRKETQRKQSGVVDKSKASVKAVTGKSPDGDAAQKAMREMPAKRDFFGRVIHEPPPVPKDGESASNGASETFKAGRKVWVTFHEGFSNAVRKPISMGELLTGL
ncbi:hypothetical protein NUU61_002400 [Penicillium alfredii]|uniref:AAA+ ATPase domain-containing protein n=1 Tax=Penicillium alfredii TaxID=1506179 RepID=A0A9W9FRI3_9EURO|nr:uncharacterized protein NUU61_002400 [Penicillium alfredii]KAJ5105053.1 hypothetical protein NUU61_002400 [Penicillium alfredii]